jgi:hypothetical protein
MRASVVVAILLAAVNVVLVLMLLLARWWMARVQRRHDALVQQLRRPAVELVDGDEPVVPPNLGRVEREVFAELLSAYSRGLRGTAKDRIVAYFETSGAVDEQIGRLRGRRSSTRAAAAFALGDMGSARAIPGLLNALDDPSRDVRMAATRSLGRIGAVEAIGPLVSAGVSGKVPTDVADLALLDIGPPAVGHLLVMASDPDPYVRSSALELIGLLGSAGDADSVVGQLTDPSAEVRVAAAGALGRLGASAARDALMRALDDRVPGVRAAAAHALGYLGGRQASEALLSIAQNDEFDVARAAADALARVDPRALTRAADEPGAGPHLLEAADRVAL